MVGSASLPSVEELAEEEAGWLEEEAGVVGVDEELAGVAGAELELLGVAGVEVVEEGVEDEEDEEGVLLVVFEVVFTEVVGVDGTLFSEESEEVADGPQAAKTKAELKRTKKLFFIRNKAFLGDMKRLQFFIMM